MHRKQGIRINYRGALPHLVIAHQVHPQTFSVHLLLYDDLIRLSEGKKPWPS